MRIECTTEEILELIKKTPSAGTISLSTLSNGASRDLKDCMNSITQKE